MKKRILIPTFYANYGGSVIVLLETYRILKRRYEVDLLAPLKEANLPATSVEPIIDTTFKKIVNGTKLLGVLLKEAISKKIRRYDLIYVHDMPSLYVYGTLGKLFGVPVLFHVHQSQQNLCKNSKIFFLSDFRIYVSPNFSCESSDSCSITIFNPVRFFDKDLPRQRNSPLRVGIVGNISPIKNQHFAIQCLPYLPNIQLLLFGEIHNQVYFKSLSIDKEKVVYCGYRPFEEVMKSIDLLWVPSKNESFGLVFLEALASGIPALVPDIPVFQTLSRMIGYETYLYKSNDIKSCTQALKRVLALQEEELTAFSRKTRKLFGQKIFEQRLITWIEKKVF